MQPKNKLTRYYNLIRRFSNWRAYLWFKGRGKADAFLFKLRNSLAIEVPRTMLPAFKESFFDDIYFRRLPPYTINKSNPVVIDIGANAGFFSLYMLSRFPRARVFAFEPMPFNFGQLQRYRASYPRFEWHVINQAVSDTTEPLVLHTTKTDGYTTMASVFADPRNQESLSVETTTLDEVMRAHQLLEIDFLKLDCEGSEYAILYGLPAERLRKIRAMCVETHRGAKPDENTLALCDYLRGQQFSLDYLDQGKSGYIWAWRTSFSS